MPVFLVGHAYWQPIMKVSFFLLAISWSLLITLWKLIFTFSQGLKETLSGDYDGQFIKYSDLDNMTVVGTSDEDLHDVMERII